MTLNIIERYLLRRMTSVFLAATISTLTIAWTVQVLNRINLVTDTGQSALDFLQLATLILPNVVPEVMPIAVAIGVAHALTTMNTDSELVVINAAGTSRMTLAKPVLVLAGAACIATFLVHNVVAPITRETVREMIAEARAGLISTLIQEGAFRRIDDNLFLQVGERRADGQLGSVFVADSRTKDVDLTYYAKTAVLGEKDGANFLAMRDGEIHRNRPGEPVSIIRFNSYVFDLAEFTPSTGKVNLWPKDRPLTYLLNPDPDDTYLKSMPGLFVAEIHSRLTTWLNPLVFGLIALSIAGNARSHREARLHPMISTIGTVLLVRWMSYFSFGKADETVVFAFALYVIPIAAIALTAWLFATSRTLELPAHQAERMQALADSWRNRAARLLPARLQAWLGIRGAAA